MKKKKKRRISMTEMIIIKQQAEKWRKVK